jgi:hypothetical protein
MFTPAAAAARAEALAARLEVLLERGGGGRPRDDDLEAGNWPGGSSEPERSAGGERDRVLERGREAADAAGDGEDVLLLLKVNDWYSKALAAEELISEKGREAKFAFAAEAASGNGPSRAAGGG